MRGEGQRWRVSGHGYSVQRKKRAVVVIRVVGLARVLLDDEPLSIARAPWDFSVDVVLFIAPAGQPAFPVVKHLSADIARQRYSVTLFERLEKCIGLLRRRAVRLLNLRRRQVGGSSPARPRSGTPEGQ